MQSTLRPLFFTALALLVAYTDHNPRSLFRSLASVPVPGRRIHVLFNLGSDANQETLRRDGGLSAYDERTTQIRQTMEARGWEIIELSPTTPLPSTLLGLMRTLNGLPSDLRELNLTFLGHGWLNPLPQNRPSNERKDARTPRSSDEWSEYAGDAPNASASYVLLGTPEQTLMAADVRVLLHGVLSRNPNLQIHVDVMNCFGGSLALTLAGLPRTETYSASPASVSSVTIWRSAAEFRRYEDYPYYFYRAIAEGSDRHQAHQHALIQMIQLSRSTGNLNLATSLSFLPVTPTQSYANRWCSRELPSLSLAVPDSATSTVATLNNPNEALQSLETSAESLLAQVQRSVSENGCTAPLQLERMNQEETSWTQFLFAESARWATAHHPHLSRPQRTLYARCLRRPQHCLFYFRAHLRTLEHKPRPGPDLESCGQSVSLSPTPANVLDDLQWSERLRACFQEQQTSRGTLSYSAISWALTQMDQRRFKWHERYCEHSDEALAALGSDLACTRRFRTNASPQDLERLNQIFSIGKTRL